MTTKQRAAQLEREINEALARPKNAGSRMRSMFIVGKNGVASREQLADVLEQLSEVRTIDVAPYTERIRAGLDAPGGDFASDRLLIDATLAARQALARFLDS